MFVITRRRLGVRMKPTDPDPERGEGRSCQHEDDESRPEASRRGREHCSRAPIASVTTVIAATFNHGGASGPRHVDQRGSGVPCIRFRHAGRSPRTAVLTAMLTEWWRSHVGEVPGDEEVR